MSPNFAVPQWTAIFGIPNIGILTSSPHIALYLVADVWLQRLDRRHAHVRPVRLPTLPLDADKRDRVRTGALSATYELWPSVVDVTRDPMLGPLRRMPWDALVWNVGVDGDELLPAFISQHEQFWHHVNLKGHPLRDGVVLS